MSDTFQWTDESVIDLVEKVCKEYESRGVTTIFAYNFILHYKEQQSKQNNKDWEIVEWNYYQQNKYPNKEREIRAVRRLSDNEVFSIGDDAEYNGMNKGFAIKIAKFQIINGQMYLVSEQNNKSINILDAKKAKQKLFTTEDGKDIYEGDKVWWLIAGKEEWHWQIHNCGGIDVINSKMQDDKEVRTFSTEAAAKEYIIMNKPCLSLNEVFTCIQEHTIEEPGSLYKVIIYKKVDTQKLKQLIQQKLSI